MILVDLLVSAVQQTFWVLYEGALFILIGFAIAGAVHVVLNPREAPLSRDGGASPSACPAVHPRPGQ